MNKHKLDKNNPPKHLSAENQKKYHEILSVSSKKYFKSYYVFVALNIIAITIAAATIVLNLFGMRYNPFPEETMVLFLIISIISVAISFILSVQTFLSIKDSKNNLQNNIETNQSMIDKIQNKEKITRDEIDQILNTF